MKNDNIKHERIITDNPKELVDSIQKYQSKILFLISVGKIDRKSVVFSNIGYGE